MFKIGFKLGIYDFFLDGGWPDHPGNGDWPYKTDVTWSSFCELSLDAKFKVCSKLPSGRFFMVGDHPGDGGWPGHGG